MRWSGLAVAALASLVGVVLALVLSAAATATPTYIWTPYNLTSLGGGQSSASQPSLLQDPQTGQLEAVVNAANGDTIQFGGDGASPVTATNVTGVDGGGSTTGTPAALRDPGSGDFLIFTDTSSGNLIEDDRNPSSFAWQLENLGGGCCNGGGPALPTIAGSPSVTSLASNDTIALAADSANGDLIVDSRATSFAWSGTNVSSAVGPTISGDPDIVDDPSTGDPDVFADSADGHLLEFVDSGSGWSEADLTNDWGGQTISGDPKVLIDAGGVDVFAEAPGGDLIEWTRALGATSWSSQNLTTLSGGPEIASTPTAIVDPSGGIDVFAAGRNEDLIEYLGSGSSWSGTDLTVADGASTIQSAPTPFIDPQSGNLVVDATSPAGDLIELARNAAPPAPAATVTQTVVSTPPPTHATKAVVLAIKMDWIPGRTRSEIRWVHLGRIRPGEGFAIACRGTGKSHRRGCPYRLHAGTTQRAIEKVVRETGLTFYGVGSVVTLTVSQKGRRSQVTYLTVRSDRAPRVLTRR